MVELTIYARHSFEARFKVSELKTGKAGPDINAKSSRGILLPLKIYSLEKGELFCVIMKKRMAKVRFYFSFDFPFPEECSVGAWIVQGRDVKTGRFTKDQACLDIIDCD